MMVVDLFVRPERFGSLRIENILLSNVEIAHDTHSVTHIFSLIVVQIVLVTCHPLTIPMVNHGNDVRQG